MGGDWDRSTARAIEEVFTVVSTSEGIFCFYYFRRKTLASESSLSANVTNPFPSQNTKPRAISDPMISEPETCQHGGNEILLTFAHFDRLG